MDGGAFLFFYHEEHEEHEEMLFLFSATENTEDTEIYNLFSLSSPSTSLRTSSVNSVANIIILANDMPEKLMIGQNNRKTLFDKGLLKARCINQQGGKAKYSCILQH